MNNVDVHAPATAVTPTPARAPNSTMQAYSQRELVACGQQQDFWLASGDISASFRSPSASLDESPAPSRDILSLADQLNSPSQLQGFLGTDDDFNAMLLMDGESNTTLGMEIDPLLGHGEDLLAPTRLQCVSATSSLTRFREEIDQHIATVDTYYSDTAKVPERCKDEGAGQDVGNPAALLLTCSKEFTDIIQNLTPTAQLETLIGDTLSTEVVLLTLSSYLALMKLFDCVFHRIYQYLCQVPPESWESIKVKSVLRIGGISSLQDMPLKTYAIGILDAIKAQVQTLERCMGIPAEYCLSGESSTSLAASAPGIFSSPPRARLFWAVMAQEDVRSLRDSKSYVESIRASIKDSMAFLND